MTVRIARHRLALAWVVVLLITLAAGIMSFTVAHAFDNSFAYGVATLITLGAFVTVYDDVARARNDLQAAKVDAERLHLHD